MNLNRLRTAERIKPAFFIFPVFFLYTVFVIYPAIRSLYLSFFNWNGIAPVKKFVGFKNYIQLFLHDTVFVVALKNNILWTIGSLAIISGLGLVFAVVLNQRIRGRYVFRGILYFPYILSGIMVGMVWNWMYHPSMGLINDILGAIGLTSLQIPWLATRATALPAIFLAALWQSIGFSMVIFLAGLQTIPQEQYESAKIDGASAFRCFKDITVPMLRETFIIVFATTLIGSFKVYDIVYVMTGGGPAQSTQVLALWMYLKSFYYYNIGEGAALSWVMIIVIMSVAIPYIKFMTKESHV